MIFQVDYGIETTRENQVCQSTGTEWSGPNNTGTAARGKLPCYGMFATVRNNLFYKANSCGMSIGGYAPATKKGGGSNGGGSADEGTPSGDYQVGGAQGDYFENNVVYSGSPNIWINSYDPVSPEYPAPPATLNWNLYHSEAGYVEGTSILWADVNTYTSFANWQSTSGEDANSVNGNPQFVDLGDTPPNFNIHPTSPAIGAGSTRLSCSVGWCDPHGSSPNSIYGSTDFLGNRRTKGSSIDIGAYQNTGTSIHNKLRVDLTAATDTLKPGRSTTLTTTVSAIPGGAGVPSGTVSYMLGRPCWQRKPYCRPALRRLRQVCRSVRRTL